MRHRAMAARAPGIENILKSEIRIIKPTCRAEPLRLGFGLRLNGRDNFRQAGQHALLDDLIGLEF